MRVADVAVIGGTGFYSFLEASPDGIEEHAVTTPYGDPSAPVAVGTVAGRRVAFLPRHGRHHDFPPHRINYRANLWALRSLGVRQVLAPCAVGGLSADVAPGDLVVPDQLVDRTSGRVSSYVERGAVHLPFADPYCPRVSDALVAAAPDVRRGGTMVVIEGPRFSTRAESQWYAAQGGTLINMTGAPRGGARPRAADVLRRAGPGDRHGRRRRGRVGRRPGRGVRAVPREPRAADRSARHRDRGAAGPRGLHLLDLGRGHRAHLRGAREGPADRVGRLHRDRGRRGPRGGRPRGGPSRPDAADGARRGRAAGGHPPPRRPRRRGLGRPAARCGRGLPPGRRRRRRGARGRPARVRRPQRPRHRRAAGRDARGGRRPAGAGLLDGGLRRGPLPVPRARRPGAAAPGGRRARGGRLRQPLPALRPPAGLGAGRRGRAARPALVVRRQQGRPGALHLRVGAPGGRASGGAALPQRLRAGDAAGHAVLRRGRAVPVLAGARRAAAGLRGRRPDPRLRARHRRGAGQPGRAAGGHGRRDAGVRRLQRRLRAPGPDPRRGHAGGRGHRPRHRARGDRRLPARRRPPRRRLAGAGDGRARLHRRGALPSRGCRRSRPRRCARDPHDDSSAVRRAVHGSQSQTNGRHQAV